MSDLPCRWVVQGGIRFHVPGCWGTVHDPDGHCHCPTRADSLDERLDAIERELASLKATPESPHNPGQGGGG